VNAQGSQHGIALQAAASIGSYTIVKLLLDQGANIGLRTVDFQGASLLHVAVACKDRNTLKLLLEAGAYICMADTDAFNQTPLHIAVILLLSRGLSNPGEFVGSSRQRGGRMDLPPRCY
jgi:ankyrin repeat protein